MRLRLGIIAFAGAALLLPAIALAAPGSLTFIEAEVDGAGGVTGLQGPALVATSPDARHVYAVSYSDDSLVAFARDPGNGGLSFVESEIDDVGGADGLDGAFGVAVAPDGRHVYVGSYGEGQDLNVSGAVATFDRDPATGAVTYTGHVLDNIAGVDGLDSVEAVALSPDGRHLYAAGNGDDSVPAFARDPATGDLTFVEREEDGVAGVDGIDDVEGITVSPDGLSVYAVGPTDDAVAHFVRDPVTGALSFAGQDRDGIAGVNGLANALGVAVSPDGRNVYVTGESDDAVVTFARDVSTGALTFLELDQDGVGGVDGLDGARNVVVSPDGAQVYVVSDLDNSVVTFDRDPATGALTLLEREIDGVGGVDGLDTASAVDVSCDGAHVFTTGQSDNAVSSFSREGTPGDCAPDLTLTAKPKQKLRKQFAVNVSCGNEACAAEAAATLRLGRRSKQLATVRDELGFQETRVLELTLKKRLRRKAARALENRKKVSAAVAVSAADLAGNAASAETTVKLKRRRKR